MSRLLPTLGLSVGVVAFMFIFTYLPQAAVLSIFNGPLAVLTTVLLALSESSTLINILSKSFLIDEALVDTFDGVRYFLLFFPVAFFEVHPLSFFLLFLPACSLSSRETIFFSAFPAFSFCSATPKKERLFCANLLWKPPFTHALRDVGVVIIFF